MGCDGGTIPRRDELVKIKTKPETRDKTAHTIFQWKYCNLTQLLLQRPIVTCGLGKLYNKSSIIEALINKSPLPDHIKSLKDTKELNLTPNPSYREETRSELETSPYICPITGLEMSGTFKFCAIWTCGCVISERGLKEIGNDSGRVRSCPKCLKNFQSCDLVFLNTGEDHLLEQMTKLIKDRKRNLGGKAADTSGLKRKKCEDK